MIIKIYFDKKKYPTQSYITLYGRVALQHIILVFLNKINEFLKWKFPLIKEDSLYIKSM